jgi:hypothetical protein
VRPVTLVLALIASCVMCGCGGGRSSGSILPAAVHGSGASRVHRLAAPDDAYELLVAASNPIAYYRLNDTNAVLTDSGTQHLNGTYGANVGHDGVALTSDTGSQSGVFSGAPAGSNITQNSATVAAIAPFAVATSTLTVEAWIEPGALNATNRFIPIVSFGREVQGQAWVLQISPQSTLNFWMKTTGGSAPSSEAKGDLQLAPGQAYHVVATYDGSNLRLYVDGNPEATTPASGAIDYSGIQPQTALAIGAALGSTEPIFAGSISDVAVYATVLPATTIAQHFNVGQITATPAPVFTPNFGAYPALVAASKPIAYYPLNDTGATLTDSINKLDGVYGVNVQHGGSVLTSSGHASSLFPGSPNGANIAAYTGTVPANRAFYTAATITVEAWVRPVDYNRTGLTEPIVSYGEESIGSVWSLQLTGESRLAFSIKVNGGPGSYLISAVPLLPAQVYQVVGSYDGTTTSLYINGALVASESASGSLNYSNIPPQNALTIGGATGGTLPAFSGAMSDVSIYPAALAASVIENHYLIGHLVSVLVETPKQSDGFVDTIGVVTHLLDSSGPYAPASFPTIEALLIASGIRHIGDALATAPEYYPAEINALASDGIHASLVTSPGQTAATIEAALPMFSNAIESIGGLNEPDDSGNPNWVAPTQAFQQMLWTTVKNNPATATLPVIGPGLTSVNSDIALGNLSSFMDYGSMHDYFDGYNPGTAGWGNVHAPGVYGSISYNLNSVAVVSGTKPAIASETGYGDAPTDGGGVDDRTLARYVPRIYLEHYLDGVARTTIYELFDEPGGGNFDDFGLVQLNNAPKSSYYALQSLIGVLADPGSTFATTPFTYVLAGNVNALHHLLLQKRNGSYELVLWLETPSYDPNAKVDITVPRQAVTLKLMNAVPSATISTIGDTGALTSSGLPFLNGIATVLVDDHVSIVTFQ